MHRSLSHSLHTPTRPHHLLLRWEHLPAPYCRLRTHTPYLSELSIPMSVSTSFAHAFLELIQSRKPLSTTTNSMSRSVVFAINGAALSTDPALLDGYR